MEQLLGQDADALNDIKIGIGNTDPNSLGVQAPVAHEVPNELGQRSVDRVGHSYPAVTDPIGLVKHRQRNQPRLAHHRAELHGNQITRGNVRKSLPDPLASVWLNHLDPVRERPLDAVAGPRADATRRFLSVNEELRRTAGTVVG